MGIERAESSLARVSLVTFHGRVIMDVLVRQKGRVVDYRTMEWHQGVGYDLRYGYVRLQIFNPPSLTLYSSATPFEGVQKRVSDFLKDKNLLAMLYIATGRQE